MSEQILDIVLSQHRKIESYLKIIEEEIKISSINLKNIISLKNLLDEHKKIEEEKSYPDFLKGIDEKLEKNEADEYHKVVNQMNDVLKRVDYFFDIYQAKENIENIDKFKNDFLDLKMALEIRISVEELTIYKKWQELEKS